MIQDLFTFLNISPWTVLHWLLAISITLFIIDIFCQTEGISWIALVGFAVYFTLYLDTVASVPMQWSVIVFFIILILEFVLYYNIWIKLGKPVIHKWILRDAALEQGERGINEVVCFRLINEKSFVEWDGELWIATPADHGVEPVDRERVRIIAKKEGKFIVEKIHQHTN